MVNLWTFKRVVNYYGYPVFSKRVSNAIRTYQHALTPKTQANSIDYMERNFKKYLKYKNLPISDKCCDKLKRNLYEKKAKELGLECAIIGILASESYQREKDWLDYGCNVFHIRKDNQSRPLSFWTTDDINEYIWKNTMSKYPDSMKWDIQEMDACIVDFGAHLENPLENRFQKLKKTHPVQYTYFYNNFGDLISSLIFQFD